MQSVHPTLVLGAVVCKWSGGTELGCLDAQSSRTLTDVISPMPLVPTNQSPPMQRNSIIAQDMSSITFLNIRLRRPLRPAESETRLYCSTRRKPRTRQHSSVTACATDCPPFPEKKTRDHHDTRHRVLRRRPSAFQGPSLNPDLSAPFLPGRPRSDPTRTRSAVSIHGSPLRRSADPNRATLLAPLTSTHTITSTTTTSTSTSTRTKPGQQCCEAPSTGRSAPRCWAVSPRR